jgi:NADH-quinone oxidoreductase subunit J
MQILGSHFELAELVMFLLLGGASLVGALLTITRRNPVSAVMALVFTFFMLAGLYATLDAHFVAILQILVYAGAIMVLFIFVVMILNREEVSPISFKGIGTRLLGVVAGAYVAWVGATAVWSQRLTATLNTPTQPLPPDYGTVATAGVSLFRDFVFPFEAISLLLLVAIVGGVIVSRSAHQSAGAEETARRLEGIRLQAHPAMRLLPGGGQVAEGGDDQGGEDAHEGDGPVTAPAHH